MTPWTLLSLGVELVYGACLQSLGLAAPDLTMLVDGKRVPNPEGRLTAAVLGTGPTTLSPRLGVA